MARVVIRRGVEEYKPLFDARKELLDRDSIIARAKGYASQTVRTPQVEAQLQRDLQRLGLTDPAELQQAETRLRLEFMYINQKMRQHLNPMAVRFHHLASNNPGGMTPSGFSDLQQQMVESLESAGCPPNLFKQFVDGTRQYVDKQNPPVIPPEAWQSVPQGNPGTSPVPGTTPPPNANPQPAPAGTGSGPPPTGTTCLEPPLRLLPPAVTLPDMPGYDFQPLSKAA
jgi:hypothetical protein